MEAIRELARREKRKLSEVVNELLLEGLENRKLRKEPTPFELPSFSMGKPRVNLADRDTLEAVMDDG